MTWSEERDELLETSLPGDENLAMEPVASYGNPKPYSIVERSRLFALEVIDFAKVLYDARWWPVGDQILRSGTSIGANMNEAQQAESRRDFLHKVRISAKEAKETRFWLSLCRDSPHLPYLSGIYEESDEITAILNTIIARTVANDPKNRK